MARNRLAVVAILFLSLWVLPSSSPAQAPVPKWSAVEEAVGKENYAEAKKQADAILQRGTPEDRAKTMTVYARILLGLGQKEQARQFLNTLSGNNQNPRPRDVCARSRPARRCRSTQPGSRPWTARPTPP